MQKTLAEIERCRHDLGLPTGAELSLIAFHRAEQLQPHIHELQRLTEEQNNALRVRVPGLVLPHIKQPNEWGNSRCIKHRVITGFSHFDKYS